MHTSVIFPSPQAEAFTRVVAHLCSCAPILCRGPLRRVGHSFRPMLREPVDLSLFVRGFSIVIHLCSLTSHPLISCPVSDRDPSRLLIYKVSVALEMTRPGPAGDRHCARRDTASNQGSLHRAFASDDLPVLCVVLVVLNGCEDLRQRLLRLRTGGRSFQLLGRRACRDDAPSYPYMYSRNSHTNLHLQTPKDPLDLHAASSSVDCHCGPRVI